MKVFICSSPFLVLRRRYRSRTRRRDDRRDVSPKLRSRASGGEHDEVITAHGGCERSGERRSAEWRRVGGSTSRARHCGHAQLWLEGETRTRLWRDSGIGSLKGRRQETYDVIEIGLIVDAGDPGLIWGARMRERDGSDDQKRQQHDAQARGTRSVQAIKKSHSRLVRNRSLIARAGDTMGLERSTVKTIRTV